MIIYNLFPLLAGTAGKWESHFRRAADMGYDCNGTTLRRIQRAVLAVCAVVRARRGGVW